MTTWAGDALSHVVSYPLTAIVADNFGDESHAQIVSDTAEAERRHRASAGLVPLLSAWRHVLSAGTGRSDQLFPSAALLAQSSPSQNDDFVCKYFYVII